MTKRWMANGLLFIASSALAAVLVEAVFRQVAHRVAGNGEWFAVGRIMDDADPLLGFSLRPSSSQLSVRGGAYTWRARINQLGMHDVERSATRPPGSRRILLLGDSFAFGPGVRIEDNFSQVLERALPATEVLNAGVPGYNTGQEYLYYLHRGRKLGARTVVLAFFINDLAPPRGAMIEEGENGLPLAFRPVERGGRVTREPGEAGWKEWLRSRALLYEFARLRLGRTGATKREAPDESAEARQARTPEAIAFFRPQTVPKAAAAWERAYRILDALKAETLSGGAALAIVAIPAPFQLSKEKWAEWVAWLGVDPQSIDRTMPQTMLTEWCHRSATPCLDLISAITEGGGERLYIPHDLHWTAEGHALAGAALARFLTGVGS